MLFVFMRGWVGCNWCLCIVCVVLFHVNEGFSYLGLVFWFVMCPVVHIFAVVICLFVRVIRASTQREREKVRVRIEIEKEK